MTRTRWSWRFCLTVLASTAFVVGVWPATSQAGDLPPAGHFTLWQLPTQTNNVMMSYVIQGPTGHVAVIDGGWVGDTPYLKKFLQGLGGRVDDWFISHQHPDHIGALTAILPKLDGLKIDRIYASLLSEEWFQQQDPESLQMEESQVKPFNAALKASGMSVIEPKLGEEIVLDGLKFQVLLLADEKYKNKGLTGSSPTNNQSMVVRLSTSGTSVLFLGDLALEGGMRLLGGKLVDRLPSEYVQMAHHGNWAVGREVYEAVKAKYALWPTPDWLWDAPMDNPAKYTTPVYRQWMKELGIQKNYVMRDGLIRLDLPVTKPVGTNR